MTKRHRIWIGLLAALLAGGVVWALFVPHGPEDFVIEGHPLSWWLRSDRFRDIAHVDRFDSNAAPYLVHELARREGWWRKVYTNLPAAIRNHIPPPFPDAMICRRAASLLARVQPASPQTIKVLIRVAQKDDEIEVRLAAIDALGNLATGHEDAVAAVAGIAQTDASAFVRIIATRTLGAIGSRSPMAVQVLIALASARTNFGPLRIEAIKALGNLRRTNPEAAEAIKLLTSDPDGEVQQAAEVVEGKE